MNQLKIFENKEFGKVRTVIKNAIPMFCLSDICKVLEIGNSSDVKKRLAESGIDNIDVRCESINGIAQNRKFLFINESNLYKAIFQSRKDSAIRFTEWVTSEVLPSIRQTGSYSQSKNLSVMDKVALIAQATTEVNERIEEVANDLEDFKQELPLLGCDMDRITTVVKKLGVKCLGGKESNAYKDKSIRQKVYSDIYDQLKRQFGVTTYKSIRRNQCDLAVQIVDGYQLPMILKSEIDGCNAQIGLDL